MVNRASNNGSGGAAGLEKIRALAAKQEAADVKALGAAKAKAKTGGKEPFNFAAFEKLYDLSSASPRGVDTGALSRQLEKEYYLGNPEVKTLKDFAAKKAELASHGD